MNAVMRSVLWAAGAGAVPFVLALIFLPGRRALALNSSSVRSRYSAGASDCCRGRPWAARARSIRAYAATTARRGSRSS